MVADADGFLVPQIDTTKCVNCHLCEKVCPVLHPETPDVEPKAYAAYTKDRDIRAKSSSGGIFSELATAILEAGGVVFGCVLQKPELVAIHTKAETLEALEEMRGSKYVQSDVRNTYREVKELLLQGRKVLYSGTPCQIAGLKHFLGKAYDNLLTITIICHGTPSPRLFEKYKAELTRDFAPKSLVHVAFRDKKYSWRRFSLVSTFDDGSELREDRRTNYYLRAFLKDICLRSSCYACASCENRSRADFTLADFWGIEGICPELDDDKGTSLVLVHTAQGQQLWERLLPRLNAQEVSFAKAISVNNAYFEPTHLPSGRAYFMPRYARMHTFKSILKRSIKGHWTVHLKNQIKKRVQRIAKFFKRTPSN